ncbi:uncharacterized protein LOC110448518 [Mizuhopecten yessoensis]|uniref:uncharacterized protein LOC110448518 n=1 Tax=Mizuhopecten yessoensis TaxID=6573 RepID=UPI000B45D6AD|nr:uncharacterized protein LOC110448518 [Mizuhopecten yessoensis]
MDDTLLDLSKILGTNLLEAICQRDTKEARRLLRKPDIDVSVTDTAGMGCLHHAASEGFINIARQLITEKGLDVNTQDRIGQTPLHKAAAVGKKDIMVMLIALGGSLAVVDHMKNLPLTLAVKERHLRTVATLLLLGSPAIPVDETSCGNQIQKADKNKAEEQLLELLTNHQRTVDALKHGEIRRGLQHTYHGEVPIGDGSTESSEAGSMYQMDFPGLDISVVHTSMKLPFVLTISRIRQDAAGILPQISGDDRLFGDVIECKAWFLPQTTVKMIITVDGMLRMNEHLGVKAMDEQPFNGRIEFVPEKDRNSNVTKVTVALEIPGSSSSRSTTFALIATSQKEVFEITNKPAVLKPETEPDSEIFIPERAFETPGFMNIEFADSSEANEDESDDDDPLLMTNVLDISMAESQQPNATISIKLPIMCYKNLKNIAVIGTSDSSSDETIRWTPLGAVLDSSGTLAAFQVSHFSTYVGVSREMVQKSFQDVSVAASRSLRKQRKVIFFVMFKSPDTKTEPYSVVVECCTKRKFQSRTKHWMSNGYQGKTAKETLQQILSEYERVQVRLEGVFDPDVKPVELTFLPNSASYKVFDQIFPRIKQDDDKSLASVVQDETFVGEVIIEIRKPILKPEVVSADNGCFSLKMFRFNDKSESSSQQPEGEPVSESIRYKYDRLGSISLHSTMPAERPAS